MRTRQKMEHRGENLLAGLRYDILASWRLPPKPKKKCRKCGAEEGPRLSIHCNKKSCVVACGVLRARKRLGKTCYGCGSGEDMDPLLFERPELPGIPFCWPCAEHGAAFWEWHFRVWELHDQLNEYPFDEKRELKGRYKAWPHLRLPEKSNAPTLALRHHAARHSPPAVGVPELRSGDALLETGPAPVQVKATPRPWRYAQEPCPKVLAITLHLPWYWAFFHGTPATWKDVENRKAGFPSLPAGTILVLHNGMSYKPAAEAFVKRLLPSTASLTRKDCPKGALVGAVVVQETTKGNLFLPRPASPWYLDWGTGIWLKPERWLFPTPIPCREGWFGAWKLNAELEQQVLHILDTQQPLGRV